MTPMRNRTSVPAGLLTALSVGVVSLAGCTAFNPNPSVPANNGGTTTAQPGATGGNGATTTPPAATARSFSVAANATIGGKALTNMRAELIDVRTGNIIAAGAGNYRLAQTNPSGIFAFTLPADFFNLRYCSLRFTGLEGYVTTFIGVPQNAPTTSTSQPISVTANPRTTIANALLAGSARLSANLTGAAADQMFATILADAARIEAKLAGMTPEQEASLVAALGTNASPNFTQVEAALSTAGLANLLPTADITSIVSNSLAVYATAAADGNNLTAGANPDIAGLFPGTMNVTLTDGKFTYKDATGKDVTVTVGTPTNPAPVDPNPITPTPVEGADSEEEQDSEARPGSAIFSDASKFNPTVSLSATSNTLTMRVEQAAGQEDVLQIVARIFKNQLGATFSPATVLASSVGTNTILGGASANHTITTTGATAPESVALSSRMGGGTLSGTPAYNGTWKTTGAATADVAKVQVFDQADSLYVTLRYKLNNAVETNSGHVTNLRTAPGVIAFDATKLEDLADSSLGTAEIDIFSRRGSYAQYTENIDYSNPL